MIWYKGKAFAVDTKSEKGCSVSPLLSNIVWEVLFRAIIQEKEIIIRNEEVKIVLFSDE